MCRRTVQGRHAPEEVSSYSVVRPSDDAIARQAADWCRDLIASLKAAGHSLFHDFDDTTPADTANIVRALRGIVPVIFYFGHGTATSWQTGAQDTIDKSNASAGAGRCVVSVACRAGRNLGPDAVTAGVVAWLGFTIKVPVIPPHKNQDPLGDAIVAGLSVLGTGGSMQAARDAIAAECATVSALYDTGGALAYNPDALLGHYATGWLADSVVVHGKTSQVPL